MVVKRFVNTLMSFSSNHEVPGIYMFPFNFCLKINWLLSVYGLYLWSRVLNTCIEGISIMTFCHAFESCVQQKYKFSADALLSCNIAYSLFSKMFICNSTPSCDHFGRHGEWKKYLATKLQAKVAKIGNQQIKRETCLKKLLIIRQI